MSLWWALPQFETVEAWPGRGWLVELGDGQLQFVHDLTARLPAGVEPDRRFYNPPPLPARAGDRRVARRRPARVAPDARPVVHHHLAPPSPPEIDETLLPFRAQSRAVQRRTAGRANELLLSLLNARQRREWQSTNAFWVHGAFGSVRLGRMYRIAHRSRERPDIERMLCVITRAHREIPEADEWTSMLLTLTHDPRRFFSVANVMSGCVYGTELPPLDEALRASIAAGDAQHSVFLAADLGSIARGRELVWAADWVRAHARLDAATAPAYLEHHRWLLDRVATRVRRVSPDELDAWTRSTPQFRVHATT
jgi:hypothetical protein